jgi:hypothetical protein
MNLLLSRAQKVHWNFQWREVIAHDDDDAHIVPSPVEVKLNNFF